MVYTVEELSYLMQTEGDMQVDFKSVNKMNTWYNILLSTQTVFDIYLDKDG